VAILGAMPPQRLEARGDRPAPLTFKGGAHPPYAIRWYGATSLWGHFRNLVSSAIASESIDSRDWMRPLAPEEMLAGVTRVLGLENKGTLLESLAQPLWIDWVADTGDDRDVSQAVGQMVFGEYTVDDGGETVTLPRGDVLLFGGDTAYPVATDEEIYRRVVQPWNEVLAKQDDHGRRRVWAKATYPKCETFRFATWHDPESFIIAAQQGFQRVKIEADNGSFMKDLDYVLSIASKISAEHATDHDDDGFTQRVAVRQGAVLKTEAVLKPLVMLAPYRTFIEIDQPLAQFVFRARVNDGQVHLALFEGDGGRWKLGAVAALKAWLEPKFGDVPVIS